MGVTGRVLPWQFASTRPRQIKRSLRRRDPSRRGTTVTKLLALATLLMNIGSRWCGMFYGMFGPNYPAPFRYQSSFGSCLRLRQTSNDMIESTAAKTSVSQRFSIICSVLKAVAIAHNAVIMDACVQRSLAEDCEDATTQLTQRSIERARAQHLQSRYIANSKLLVSTGAGRPSCSCLPTAAAFT